MSAPSPIPVAVFLTSFDAGGTERQMSELIRRLDRTRFEVHVACFHRRGPWLPLVDATGCPVTEFPINGFASPRTWLRALAFARWCRSRRVALVQAADLYANAFALPAAWLAGVPVRIGSRREVHPTRGRALETLQRFGYRCASRIVANSEAGAARLRAEGIASSRISVIRNGLDLSAFDVRPRGKRGHRIVTVAQFRPEKAHEVLLAAVARVHDAYADVELALVGDGPRETELRQLAIQHGLGDRVHFLGHRDDVPAVLREADVFVLPSRIEAAPNAVLEAMAAGLPVVACDVGGIPEAIRDGVNGVLVPPDDPPALAGALFDLFDNAAEAARLGLAARQHVESAYSFDHMVSAFENVYLQELARRGYKQKGHRRAARLKPRPTEEGARL